MSLMKRRLPYSRVSRSKSMAAISFHADGWTLLSIQDEQETTDVMERIRRSI